MSVITNITTMVADAKGLLLSQFWDKPLIVALLESVVEEVQTLEDLVYDTIQAFLLSSAVGVQLDILGAIVGWARNGLVDADYRRLILVGIQINRHDGQAENAAKIVSQLLDGAPAVRYRTIWPAHFQLSYDNAGAWTPTAWRNIIAEQMPRLAVMGVSWELVEGFDDDSFIFDSATRGFDLGGLPDIWEVA